jgi:hypothetical protein
MLHRDICNNVRARAVFGFMLQQKHLRKMVFLQMPLFVRFSVFEALGPLVFFSQMLFFGEKLATFAKNDYLCTW